MFAPRDARTASRALQVLLVASGVVIAVYAALRPPPPLLLGLTLLVVVATLGGAALLARSALHPPGWVWVLVPAAAVLATTLLDIATGDASAAGQIFFLLPALFAASQLRSAAAWTVAGLAAVGEVVTVVTLLPPEVAVTDAAHVIAVLVTMTFLLVRSGERSDRLMAELRHQAAVDPLTGLVTRRVLDDAASSALAAADGGCGTALVIIDVDRFKTINDTHGHPVGDQALVHVGQLLRAGVRGDTVVSRLGGDELAVLLPGCRLEVAVQRAQDLTERVRSSPLELEDGTLVALSVSVGVAHAPQHAVALAGLYRAADAALYDAKRAGRDRVGVATGPAARPQVPAQGGPPQGSPAGRAPSSAVVPG